MGGQAVPRYSQIVAELRRRIETGELAPGDRVPSTREITRQWGVAMATATKVLTELRREGMVRAVPGVGTVVAAPSRPVRAARPAVAAHPGGPSDASSVQAALTLGRIVGAAVTVAETEGLAAVSMRRVAAELGVATMSLYRHVADKDDLLTRMMDSVMAEHPLPADAPAGWREAIELAARQLWDLFRRHPWLAPALSVTRPQMITSALPYSEWMLATLHAHGLDLQSAFTAHLTLLNYARGIAVNLEAEREAEAHSGLDSEEWMDTQEPALLAILGTGRFPMLSRLATAGYDLDLDALFEFGLQRLLDGLASLLNESSVG
ncbi:TetR/AcrR family transcriptional regulator C-terminal domain-containing protein [Streptomyces sp. NBC_00091]|uniref:TetR/AcrR family transcriptional regulator C-terminal domain-containing protein n=1 Tax=Streptomyces sp. NBC_00091 TaxID=2975648 RepID=UPI00225AD0F1|nr:TetR/AcrR family transcriptional regulator C-terminal domain-containing protein [Streptomyces sp. NBC_00091]MCX5374903.1 TetR/AcrR family transcriptional regulator C-terminal domain-containing protein [Streptomyces sp. NBC_00091]MCX5380264.1 TetR/AcrR family transcriptional regulator C-terminal domain-containing protein [Streptomyces sp. NBC_00091]